MQRFYLFLAIVLITLNLRAALVTVGPVLPLIGSSLALSPSALGVLTSLPILFLGLASGVAEPFGRRIGWSAGVIVASLCIAGGTLLRSSGSAFALFAGAVILGAGIGLGNVYVPTLLKWGFARRLGIAMGVYTMCLSAGSTISVAAMPVLVQRFGGDWKPALGAWGLPALACALVWIPLGRLKTGTAASAVTGSLYRNRLAWAVTGFMGFQSTMFYGIASWYATLLQDRGLTLAAASLNLSVMYIVQVITALLLPIAVVRIARQELVAIAFPAIVACSIVAALYGPLETVLAASTLMGLTLGGLFGVALSFLVLRARRVESAARLSGMAQTVGYLMATLGPLVLGLLHGLPDPRLASTIWLVALACATMAAGSIAGRRTFVEDRDGGPSGCGTERAREPAYTVRDA